jgi:hypothetical protein
MEEILHRNMESEPSHRYLGLNSLMTKIPTPKSKSILAFTPLKPLITDRKLETPEPVKMNQIMALKYV